MNKVCKGTIALDLDGTITRSDGSIADEVAMYIEAVQKNGWDIVFVTGREFIYALQALSKMNIPYYVAAQNGADIVQMPARKLIKSFYLPLKVVKDVELLYENYPEDFLLYAGFEKGDFCFYRPKKFSEETLKQVHIMRKRRSTEWKQVEHFEHLGQDTFPMIKCVGFEKEFVNLESDILRRHLVHTTIIKDPVSKYYDLLLITDIRASKGKALEFLLQDEGLVRPLIVAGDDRNDESSLKIADVRIVMGNASEQLKNLADIVAPLAHDNGIIRGVEEAIEKVMKG